MAKNLWILFLLFSTSLIAQKKIEFVVLSNGDTVKAKILQGNEGGKLLVFLNGKQQILNKEDYSSIIIETIDIDIDKYGNSGSSGIEFLGLGIIGAHIRPRITKRTYLDLRANAGVTFVEKYIPPSFIIGNSEGYIIDYPPGLSLSLGSTIYAKPFFSNGRVKRQGFIIRGARTFNEMQEFHFLSGLSMEHFNRNKSNRSVNYELCLGLSYMEDGSDRYRYLLTGSDVTVIFTFGIIFNYYN